MVGLARRAVEQSRRDDGFLARTEDFTESDSLMTGQQSFQELGDTVRTGKVPICRHMTCG